MSSTSGLVKNIFWMGLLQVANLVLPLLTMPIIARIIGPEKLGAINYAAALIAYFTLLINYSYELTATRDVAQVSTDPRRLSALFNTVFHTKLALFAIATVLFALTYVALPQFRGDSRVALYSYIITAGSVFTPDWLFQGMQQLRKLAVANLIAKGLFTIAVLLLIRERSDYIWQPLVLSASQVVVSLGAFLYAMHRYQLRLEPFRWQPIRASLQEGKMVFFSKVTINIYSTTSIIVLGLFQTNEQVGYYSSANRLIWVAQSLLFLPIHNTLYPYIGMAFGKSQEDGLDTIRKLLPPLMIAAFLYCVGIYITSPLAVDILFGPEFKPAGGIMQLMAFYPLLININSFLGIQAMMNLRMDREFFRVTCAAAIIGLTLNVVFARQFGYWGTAVAVMLIEVFNAIAFYLALRRKGITLFDRQYMKLSYMTSFVNEMIQQKRASKSRAQLNKTNLTNKYHVEPESEEHAIRP